jgi:hypothetical protein
MLKLSGSEILTPKFLFLIFKFLNKQNYYYLLSNKLMRKN